MLRVLHIVTYMGRGGLETMLMNYYRHIDKKKVQFDFLVHRDFKADYDEEILSLGGRIYRVPRLVPWSKSYKKALNQFFKNHPEYKIIHVHQDCLSSVALRQAKKNGVPIRIAHSHNSSADKNLKYPIKMFYMRQIPDVATELFACGHKSGDWMFGRNPYHVLHNAIDTETYYPSNSAIIANKIRDEFAIKDELLIGHVGRFMPQKNHTFLIDIFSEVVKKKPEAKLMLIGSGEGKEEIEAKVNLLGIRKNVIFTGIRSDVNELMQAMDVFVFPSLYEGLPVSMIEAQAAGLPCVVSDQVSAECLITNGLVTFIKLEDSPGRWAEQILKRSSQKREEHFQEIRQQGYDIVENAKWLEEYYIGEYKKVSIKHVQA